MEKVGFFSVRVSDEWESGTRLTMTFISSLPQLLKNMEADDSACEICAAAVLPFLDLEHPPFLQEAAVAFFQSLAESQPDIVHVKLMEVYHQFGEQENKVGKEITRLLWNG